MNLQRGVTSKAKDVAIVASSSETQTSAKKSLNFGTESRKESLLLKKVDVLLENLGKSGKAKSWYEQTLEEKEDDQMFDEVNQHDLLKALNMVFVENLATKKDFPLNEETENCDLPSYLEPMDPMEEDGGYENEEERLQIDAILEEEWNDE